MLPDFPRLKNKLTKLLTARMKSVYRVEGAPFASLPFAHIQEGNCVKMIHADGSEDEIEMKHHRVTVRLLTDELEGLSIEDIYERFDQAAEQMARRTFTTFLQSLDKTVEKAGNVVKFEGRPSIDDLLRFYETVDIDFDEHGRPQLPTIMCGREMYEHLHDLIPQIQSDKETKRRFDAMLARKQEEWRDREARRRLVG